MSSRRRLFLVLYDIADPKRLARVHKAVSAYAVGGQKSFFECWLRPAERKDLAEKLSALFNPQEDRIHFFEIDPRSLRLLLGTTRRQSIEHFLLL